MSDFLVNENEEAMLEIREFLDDNDVVTGTGTVSTVPEPELCLILKFVNKFNKIEEIMSDFLANENEEAMLEIREFLDDNDVVTGSNVVNLKDELSQTKDLIGGDVGNNIGSY